MRDFPSEMFSKHILRRNCRVLQLKTSNSNIPFLMGSTTSARTTKEPPKSQIIFGGHGPPVRVFASKMPQVNSEASFSPPGQPLGNCDFTLNVLKEILSYEGTNVSSWIVENKVKHFCANYKGLPADDKRRFLQILSNDLTVDQGKVTKLVNQFKVYENDKSAILKIQDQLKVALKPRYGWLFELIGRIPNGVKFLLDLRTDVMDCTREASSNQMQLAALQKLNLNLKELLSLWFTVGFLHLERVTWRSSCEMLEKISEYEAVHKVRNWPDLKRRVGPYRRCFVYTHSSMPSEPLIVLHTALSSEILTSVKGLTNSEHYILDDVNHEEDSEKIKAAVFYSISSTQRGLQGIELGNYLIRQVVSELQSEFPHVTQFSTLSPIPTFKSWLMDRIKKFEKNNAQPHPIWIPVHRAAGSSWEGVRQILHRNDWIQDDTLHKLIQKPLMAFCAYYLYKEKLRGSALDGVANFHLKNGAVMWRLNWLADTSGRGMSNSFGMMINYRYYLMDTETNSRNYLESKGIKASEQIINLCSSINLESKL